MFEHVTIQMLDQEGKSMDQVGYVADPYEVRVDLFEPELDENSSAGLPAIDGTTVLSFAPGTGIATFDSIVLKGGLKATKLRFRLIKPKESEIVAVITNRIELLPGIGGTGKSSGSCLADQEGAVFGRNLASNAECDFACLAPCTHSITAPECGPAKCSAGSYSVCTSNQGCQCDMEAIPELSTLVREDYINELTCTAEKIEIRLNKCLLNKAGLKLKELYLNGPEIDFDTLDSLGSSSINNCRGKLSYVNGPEYVFTIDTNLTDCKTLFNASANTYKNAVQGFVDVSDERTTRRSKFMIDFTCTI